MSLNGARRDEALISINNALNNTAGNDSRDEGLAVIARRHMTRNTIPQAIPRITIGCGDGVLFSVSSSIPDYFRCWFLVERREEGVVP